MTGARGAPIVVDKREGETQLGRARERDGEGEARRQERETWNDSESARETSGVRERARKKKR